MENPCCSRKVTSPEEFFGFQMGADRKMARWDKIVQYFYRLESESDRIKVVDMGKSTEGNPFLLTIISSPRNLAKLEHYKEVNSKICDPRGLTEEAVKELVREGRVVVCQSMSLHASEIGGTQMAPELAYDLCSSDREDDLRILENVIFLMVPSFNPDGQIMVTDWYNKTLGTEYEGGMMPYLYHKYAGHDNNRDAFALNLVESQYMAKILFEEWKPQAYQDHHHMGSTGARLFIAPYSDQIRPYADPLVWREDSWYGAHMAYTLEEHNKTGILNGAQYPGWGHFGFHWITTHHNIAGMLTESASAKLATPVYIHPHQLRGASKKTMPEYTEQTNFPHPWPGGWWRLRDIVEQQKIASWALLDICARYREKVLWNAYLKAIRQTQRGAQGKPAAFIIPSCQHDPLTALKLVGLLLKQGIEIKRITKEIRVDGRVYDPGSFVVFCDQPKMGVIKALLARTFYPDWYWTRNPDGSPIMYDTATDTIAEFMGVDVHTVDRKFCGEFEIVTESALGNARAALSSSRSSSAAFAERTESPAGYFLDCRLNDAYKAVNRLLARGAKVWRLEESSQLPAGSFYVEHDPAVVPVKDEIAGELGVWFHPVSEAPVGAKRQLKALRIGMYQRYWGGNMDEGWTRLLLEKFEYPYVTLMDADIKAGSLIDRLDVIILPTDRKEMMIGQEAIEKNPRARAFPIPPMPPEYRSGLGKDGAKALADFVKEGGRLVAIDTASDYAIEALELKIRNVVANLDHNDFYCHGSTLRAKIDNGHPLAYGMPEEALVLNFGSPTFEITDMFGADNYEVIAYYPERDLLQSGWLIGESRIAKKPCVIKARVGEGEAILIGFRANFRAQTHGTFKMLFNCLL